MALRAVPQLGFDETVVEDNDLEEALEERDRWESHAVGMAGAAIGSALGVWMGGPVWFVAAVYVAIAIAIVWWANR